MKKILSLVIAVVLGAGAIANAAPKRAFPNQKDGSAVAHPFYGGYSYFTETDATESMVCTGKCLLVGFYRGTGAATTRLEIRDTLAIGGDTSLFMFPQSHFATVESHYTAQPMDRPALASNGISVKLTSVSAGEQVTVVYLDLDD